MFSCRYKISNIALPVCCSFFFLRRWSETSHRFWCINVAKQNILKRKARKVERNPGKWKRRKEGGNKGLVRETRHWLLNLPEFTLLNIFEVTCNVPVFLYENGVHVFPTNQYSVLFPNQRLKEIS